MFGSRGYSKDVSKKKGDEETVGAALGDSRCTSFFRGATCCNSTLDIRQPLVVSHLLIHLRDASTRVRSAKVRAGMHSTRSRRGRRFRKAGKRPRLGITGARCPAVASLLPPSSRAALGTLPRPVAEANSAVLHDERERATKKTMRNVRLMRRGEVERTKNRWGGRQATKKDERGRESVKEEYVVREKERVRRGTGSPAPPPPPQHHPHYFRLGELVVSLNAKPIDVAGLAAPVTFPSKPGRAAA